MLDLDQNPYQMNMVSKHWKKLYCYAMKKVKSGFRIIRIK